MKNTLLLALLLPAFVTACSDKGGGEDTSIDGTTDGGTTDGGTTDGGTTDGGTTDGGTTDGGTTDGGTTDGGTTDGGTTDGGTTDGGTTDDVGTVVDGVEITSVDSTTWADVGYEMVVMEVTEDAEEPYDSLFEDQRPTFYLWRPAEAPDGPIPLLVWFHGSAVGDDTAAEEGGELPDPCRESQITGGTIETNLVGPSMAPKMAAYRGWAMVMPRNDWCDAWIGRGPEDPVDPERHYGYYHVARTLDWLRAGNAGFEVDDDAIYAWGTSSGGTGAVIAANRYDAIDAVVFDSSVSSWLTYYERAGTDLGTNTSEVVHIFGGDPWDEDGEPTPDVYDRYVEASPAQMILDGGFRKPIFETWNNEDQNLGTAYASEMISAFNTSYGDTYRWFEKDLDHLYPEPRGHVQTIYGQLPLGYLPWTAFEFLSGAEVIMAEAEDGCAASPCTVGFIATSDDDSSYEGFSGARGRTGPEGEEGTLYTGRLPNEIPAGAAVRVSLSIKSYGHNALPSDTLLGRLVYLEGGVEKASKSYLAGMFAPDGSEGAPEDVQVLDQYAGTWLDFTPTDPSRGELRFEHSGASENRVDMAIFLY